MPTTTARTTAAAPATSEMRAPNTMRLNSSRPFSSSAHQVLHLGVGAADRWMHGSFELDLVGRRIEQDLGGVVRGDQRGEHGHHDDDRGEGETDAARPRAQRSGERTSRQRLGDGTGTCGWSVPGVGAASSAVAGDRRRGQYVMRPAPAVEHRVQQIGDQVDEDERDADDEREALHHGVVAGRDRVGQRLADAGEREDRLGEDRAAEQRAERQPMTVTTGSRALRRAWLRTTVARRSPWPGRCARSPGRARRARSNGSSWR